MPRVAAIIPACNEERTSGEVVGTVARSPLVDDVIVVNDGSRDATMETTRRRAARVIALHANQGKGGATAVGLAATNAQIIPLLDGDLVGLTTRHVEDLLQPVLAGTAEVCVGQIQRDLMQTRFPNFSGLRALRRAVLENISHLENTGFRIEIAVSRHARISGLCTCPAPIDHLTHVLKQEKHGVLPGHVGKLKTTRGIPQWSGRNGRSRT
ncbi:MAG TPA: glycosyltransferase [bacterium]|nr:glycosyltransferase [bacterium]